MLDVTKFKIESNIPYEDVAGTAVVSVLKSMKPGDSFLVEDLQQAKSIQSNFVVYRRRGKFANNLVVRVRRQRGGGARVWLLERDEVAK